MPQRRKGKQVVNKLTEEENRDKGIQREDKKQDEEAERQIAAIKAIRDLNIEQSLTALRLLCSYYAGEELERPVLEFFKEKLPGVSIEEENGEIEGTTENRMLASYNALRTPEVNGQRLSFGMTPKARRRQPKPGEMMLSVHGSPLGVYEENQNMGPINEESS